MPDGLVGLMASAPGARSALLPPPLGFREAGAVRAAWPCAGPFGLGRPRVRGTGAQRAGIRYERKALKWLGKEIPGLQGSPWFRFHDEGGNTRFCQPDALFVDDKRLVIFEVKVRLGEAAWWQLEHLYRPVIETAFGRAVTGLVVLCKHVDPVNGFPVVPHLLRSASEAVCRVGGGLGVLQWRS
jgi:hypothetical protein